MPHGDAAHSSFFCSLQFAGEASPGTNWDKCANLHLLSAEFQQVNEGALLRLRYRELTPAEFLTATGDGSLSEADLNEAGQAFTRDYYATYQSDFEATFNGDVYAVQDNWANYDRIAAVLTSRYMAGTGRVRARKSGSRHGGKWWRFW